jgi:hypothetical protein
MKQITDQYCQYCTNIKNIRAWCEDKIDRYFTEYLNSKFENQYIILENSICISPYNLGMTQVNRIASYGVIDEYGDGWEYGDIGIEDMLRIVRILYDRFNDE